MWWSETEVALVGDNSYKLQKILSCSHGRLYLCIISCSCISIVFVFVFATVLYLQCIDDGNLIMNGDLRKILTGDFRESNRA